MTFWIFENLQKKDATVSIKTCAKTEHKLDTDWNVEL